MGWFSKKSAEEKKRRCADCANNVWPGKDYCFVGGSTDLAPPEEPDPNSMCTRRKSMCNADGTCHVFREKE